ncbi:unnamed protein product [Microthlaspi erraticum]|uniref:TF-B3 domain-containing protein n=1 Tax=Microthlaspi erraticum TaxID=1685480 RepID=A0A6D2J894_9BRAS|nr:unnamed protein product [Microthlaspi erraticum]
MRIPRNPNSQLSLSSCLTEKKSRKRRALQDNKRAVVKSKKASLMIHVTPGESRLSMPFNELICKDFLTPSELRVIREDIDNVNKRGVGAILVDEQNVKYGVMLKRWEMKKDSGNGSWNYALTCGWNDVVTANGLKQNDNISIWCFRWGGLLCFALVTPPPSSPSMAQSSSPLALCL